MTCSPATQALTRYRLSGLYCCGCLGSDERHQLTLRVSAGLNLLAHVRNDPINFDNPGVTTKAKKASKTSSDPGVPGPSQEQAAAAAGTAASTNSEDTTASTLKASPNIYDNDSLQVMEGFTRLWHASDEMREIEFIYSIFVSAVLTTGCQSFNLAGVLLNGNPRLRGVPCGILY